jgi:signal transduction histidine kinase
MTTAVGGGPPLAVARSAAAIAIVVYAASWVANRYVPGFVDPLWIRAAVVAIVAAAVVGTYTSAWVVRNIAALLRAVVYLVLAHDYLLLYWNELDALQVVGTYLVLAGVVATASLFVTRPRHLFELLVVVAAASVAVALLLARTRTPRAQFLIGIGAFIALAYVAVSAHLHTLARLWRTQRELLDDIARREVAEGALRDSEAQARAVLRAVPDVLVRVGPDGIVRSVLGEEGGDLARRAADLVGRPLAEIMASPDPAVSAGLAAPVAPGAVRSFTGPVRDGDTFVEIRLSGADADSRLGLLRDVTRERELEERLRVADRLAAIGTLASGVAHEINNPLSYVAANVEFAVDQLRNRLRATSDPETLDQLDALTDARDGAERIARIVDNLKQYARGVQRNELGADAGECVRAALRILDSQVRHRAVLAVELPALPRLAAEPFRLTQVFVNLITNALQALPGPGRDAGHVWIRGHVDGASATIEVADDGAGIPAEHLSRIFDPFFTTKSPGDGTGLGLYVSHQIVTSFGGTLTAASVPGAGTTFRVVIPVAGAGQAPGPPAAGPEPAPGCPGVSFLIVDDEERVARAMARLLDGEDVTIAGSAADALQLCRARDFGLILCDVMMPDLDGPSFFHELERVRPELARRVVFITGGAFTPATREFLALTHNPCLEKPVKREELVAAAARVVTMG